MVKERDQNSLEQRLERLENKVAGLERRLSEAGEADAHPERNQKRVKLPQPAARQEDSPEHWKIQLSESWLNWMGIALLLLGVGFLFKYSIDQGWLIPQVRSAIGLGTGAALLIAGSYIDRNTLMRQILLGGGIAACYITGFATFQLYEFLSARSVWIYMVGVTVLGYVLSHRQQDAILSVIATVGGLATPFLLHTGEGSIGMLMLYTGLVLTGMGAVYLEKGWKSLLWSGVAGGFLVLLIGGSSSVFWEPNPSLSDRWSLQLGALYGALILWVVPVLREVLTRRNPAGWPVPGQPLTVDPSTPYRSNTSVQVLSVMIPLLFHFYSFAIWSASTRILGLATLVSALIVGYLYLPLKREDLPRLSMVHGFTSLILLTVSLVMLLDGKVLLVALAMEALVLRIISSHTGDLKISYSSHILFGLIAFWMADRLLDPTHSGWIFLNLDALTEFTVIAVAGLIVPGYLEKGKHGSGPIIYLLASHTAFLGWLMKEFAVLQDGQALATVAWGVYALAILFYGLVKETKRVRLLGMGTILLVVAKLFVIDLAQVNMLLRIVLFMGFGILFLGVSYVIDKRWGTLFRSER